jgi:assimilatory nitrate reductase catalytic subunit
MVSDRQQRGMLFAPIHWNEETASSARVGALVAAFTDPFSGQPEAKATPAAIAPRVFTQRGFVLSRRPLVMPDGVLWSHVAVTAGHGYLLAHNLKTGIWQVWFANNAPRDDVAAYDDQAFGTFRAAAFANGRIDLCLFSGAFEEGVEWDAVKALFAKDVVTADERRMLLSGRSGDGLAGAGPIVCACFGVGRNTIDEAIKAGACSAAEIGTALNAGTNCGSCIPELKRMLTQTAQPTVKQSEPEPLTA